MSGTICMYKSRVTYAKRQHVKNEGLFKSKTDTIKSNQSHFHFESILSALKLTTDLINFR